MQQAEVEENCTGSCFNKQEQSNSIDGHANMRRMQTECSAYEEQRWRTVTHDSYPAQQPDPLKSLGRRRQLVKNFIGLRVFGEMMDAIVADQPPQPISPSEYVDNFCKSEFIPFMDRTEYDTRKHLKYPLHGGATVQSYYKCQLDHGTLKVRSEISNLNQPFRRMCSFTTPPELALREPTGGY